MTREQNLKPFKRGVDSRRNIKGRPKKFIHSTLEELEKKGYSPIAKSQIADLYQVMIILPEKELKEIVEDQERPMIFRILAKGILGNKGFEIIEKMLDRSQGRALELNANMNMSLAGDKDFNIWVSDVRKEILEARKKHDEPSGTTETKTE